MFIKMTRGSDMTTDFVLVLEINKDVWTLPGKRISFKQYNNSLNMIFQKPSTQQLFHTIEMLPKNLSSTDSLSSAYDHFVNGA